MKGILASLLLLGSSARAGEVLWSGIFNSSFTTSDFDLWSFANEIEPWQWYIHGSGATSEYLDVSPDNKNPAANDAQGIKITIDGTSFWNGQTMERSEIIPQTTQNLGTGHLFYHFSLMTSSTNPPNAADEHQIAFFESHFTEIKYGLIDGETTATGTDNLLRWDVTSNTQWSTDLVAGQWYNFAYDIDFDAQTVALYQSNNSDPLVLVHDAVSAATSTNSADWHIGQLRLPNGGTDAAAEDWYWSGVYIESDTLTTDIAGPGGSSSGSSSGSSGESTSAASSSATSAALVASTSSAATTSVEATSSVASTSSVSSAASIESLSSVASTSSIDSTLSVAPTTSAAPTSAAPTTSSSASVTSSASGATQTEYGQCGGTGYNGPTTCAAGLTCVAISAPYYSQCLAQ